MVVCGGAIGWDTIAVDVALEVGIPYGIVVPFANQDARWTPAQKARYQVLIRNASKIWIATWPQTPIEVRALPADRFDELDRVAPAPTSEGDATNCLLRRNRALAELVDDLVVVWDKNRYGGTWRTMLHFRNRMNKIWPENMIVIGTGA
jgi:uncharacterized phage-like protein YoqJ